MKKFPITKFYFNLFVASFVIFLFLTIFYTKVIINIFSEDGPFFSGYIIIGVHAFGTIWMLKVLIFTFSGDRGGFCFSDAVFSHKKPPENRVKKLFACSAAKWFMIEPSESSSSDKASLS